MAFLALIPPSFIGVQTHGTPTDFKTVSLSYRCLFSTPSLFTQIYLGELGAMGATLSIFHVFSALNLFAEDLRIHTVFNAATIPIVTS